MTSAGSDVDPSSSRRLLVGPLVFLLIGLSLLLAPKDFLPSQDTLFAQGGVFTTIFTSSGGNVTSIATRGTKGSPRDAELGGSSKEPPQIAEAAPVPYFNRPVVVKVANNQADVAQGEPVSSPGVAVTWTVPPVIEECVRTSIELQILTPPGEEEITPQTGYVLLQGSRPDAQYYKDRKFNEWNPMVCPSMGDSPRCQEDTWQPPPRFQRGWPLVPAGKPGGYIVELYPDASALEVKLTLVDLRREVPAGTLKTPNWRERVLSQPGGSNSTGGGHSRKLLQARGESSAGVVGRLVPGAELTLVWAERAARHYGKVYCGALLNRVEVPLAQHFGVHEISRENRSVGPPLSPGATWQVSLGEKKGFLVKALPLVAELFTPEAARAAYFVGHLESAQEIIAANISGHYHEELQGFRGEFQLLDPGLFTLTIRLVSVFGSSPHLQEPLPTNAGPHMGHFFSFLNLDKSVAWGAPVGVQAGGGAALASSQLFAASKGRCRGGTELGRWINHPFSAGCVEPVCSGDRNKTNLMVDHTGVLQPWLYTPYTCHYHLFSREDMVTCAEQSNTTWIHFMGDSVVRELASCVYLLAADGGKMSGQKYSESDKQLILGGGDADNAVQKGGLRVSFKAFSFICDHMVQGTHRAFDAQPRGAKAHLDGVNMACNRTSEPCPDVYVLNPALAYTLWKQNVTDFQKWMLDLRDYLQDAATSAARQARNQPLTVVWYKAPFLWSPAHDHSSPFETPQRVTQYDDVAVEILQTLPFLRILDANLPTRSRPRESYDGLHYLSHAGDQGWMGHVSQVMMNMLLNVVFDKCQLT